MTSSAFLLLALGGRATAEGSAQLDDLVLRQDAVLYVDVLDAAVESIALAVTSVVTVYDPDGVSLGTFRGGDTVTPTKDGSYALRFVSDQQPGWDVTVLGAAGLPVSSGRLYALTWSSNSGTYGEDGAVDTSFFVLTPTGSGGETSVVEVAVEGWGGYDWQFSANQVGVDGHGSHSAPADRTTMSEAYRIYVQPPSRATYTEAAVTADDLVAEGCEPVVFRFTTHDATTYHLGCDRDGDSEIDLSSDTDMVITGSAAEGENTVAWDAEPGTWRCRVLATSGEVHLVATDVETAFPGLRLYQMDAQGSPYPVYMYWNDSLVQDQAVPMPDGQTSLESSGPDGVYADIAAVPTRANVNAHAWGNFTELGKGNDAHVDTFAWLDSDATNWVTVGGDCEAPEAPTGGYYQGGCGDPGGAALVLLVPVLARRWRYCWPRMLSPTKPSTDIT